MQGLDPSLRRRVPPLPAEYGAGLFVEGTRRSPYELSGNLPDEFCHGGFDSTPANAVEVIVVDAEIVGDLVNQRSDDFLT